MPLYLPPPPLVYSFLFCSLYCDTLTCLGLIYYLFPVLGHRSLFNVLTYERALAVFHTFQGRRALQIYMSGNVNDASEAEYVTFLRCSHDGGLTHRVSARSILLDPSHNPLHSAGLNVKKTKG